MNRDIILETIRRHLKECRDASPPTNLSELVGPIARELRREKTETGAVVSVIPIEQIAAFVDGDLDHDRVEAVNRSVMIDNSVLAELVAAVRAMQCPIESLPPIAEPLTERLLALHRVETISNRDIARMISEPETESRRLKRRLAIPVMIALAMGGWFIINRPDRGDGTAERPTDVSPIDASNESLNESPSTLVDVLADDCEEIDCESHQEQTLAPEPNDEATLAMTETSDVNEPADRVLNSTSTPTAKLAEASTDGEAPGREASPSAETSSAETSSAEVASGEMPSGGEAVPAWRSLRVGRVTGLLGRMTDIDESNPLKSIPTYVSVRRDDAVSLASPVRLRSLSQSDAMMDVNGDVNVNGDGEAGGGGQFWMDQNTMITAVAGDRQASLVIDVTEGTVAIQGVTPGSIVRLQSGATTLGRIQFAPSGQAIVRAVAGGMELHLQNATAWIDDQRVDETRIRLTRDGVSDVIGITPPTPAWSTTPTSPIDRALLHPLSESTDLARSLNSQIKRLASSTRLNDSQVAELDKLVQMQVSLAGNRLFHLVAHPIDLVRRTAVETIALLPKDDPRFQPAWASIADQLGGPKQRGQVELWMQLIRTGGAPSDEQLAMMIQGLQSTSPTIRGLGDVMLRRYVDDPPPLDPNQSPERIQPAISRFQQLIENK